MAPRTQVLGRRGAAFLIDLLLVLAVCVPLFLVVSKSGPAGTRSSSRPEPAKES